MRARLAFLLTGSCLGVCIPVQSQQASPAIMQIQVDTSKGRHPISPLIYGVNYGTAQQLQALRAPVNRSGGDSASTYNYESNARNSGRDWFFESTPAAGDILQQYGDTFVDLTRSAGADVILTVPTLGWVARLGAQNMRLAGFSTTKYGPQHATDSQGFREAGDGIAPAGPFISNDPSDAMQPDSLEREKQWMGRNIKRWNRAADGGIKFFALDNEPARWHDIHRDVHPIGAHAAEIAGKTIAFGNMVHAVDPSARVLAPEEWVPAGALESGFDQQVDETRNGAARDRETQTGGMDMLPWLLTQWKRAGRPVDIVSVHYYPQGGEYSDDVSELVQLARNRSTRALWDRSYHDIPWIPGNTALIPNLREMVDRYYGRDVPIALTEYSWGAENSMSGATAEADLLGIFGRENLSLATRWIAPAEGSPTFLAMKLFRNFDDHGASFGETSVAASTPDPDLVAAFAALRASDHALTVMLLNKQLAQSAPVNLALHGIAMHGNVELVQLVLGKLLTLPGRSYRDGNLPIVLPPQSITLLIVRAHAG